MTKIAGSGSISQRHGTADPDPYQNVMDPQHCLWLMDPDPEPGGKKTCGSGGSESGTLDAAHAQNCRLLELSNGYSLINVND
jgi:hypothetical protein